MSIASNLEKIKKEIPEQVTLVAVSKTKPVEAVNEAFLAGQLHFGENKVQEMTSKQAMLPSQLLWHQIGHLQSNKVKYLAPYVHLVHSVDSPALLTEIQKQASKNVRCIDVLLQIHIASEETKFGMDETEVLALLNHPATAALENIRIKGLMGMATNTSDESLIAKEFRRLRSLFEKLEAGFSDHPRCLWTDVSMGMSSDYRIAIAEGSTIIRVGSAIFGNRDYGTL